MDAIFVNTILSGIQQRNLEASNSAYAVFFFFFWVPKKIRAHLSHTKVYMWKTKKWY